MKKLLFLLIFLVGCDEKNEDVTTNFNKEGSVEIEITTTPTTKYTLLYTVERVWIKNQLVKTLYRVDTIPNLGLTTVEGEDVNGETQWVTVPKDYEFFITVK